MKTSIKTVIGAAVAAALSIGIMTAAVPGESAGSSKDGTYTVCLQGEIHEVREEGSTIYFDGEPYQKYVEGEEREDNVKYLEINGEYYTIHEQGTYDSFEEWVATRPQDEQEFIENEIIGLTLPPARSVVALTKKYTLGYDGHTYNFWTGAETTYNLENMSLEFNTPGSFTFKIAGRSASMTGTTNYLGNYKNVIVNCTFLENGKEVFKSESASGTGVTQATKVNYTGSGTLVEAKYFFYFRSGTGSGASYRDMVYIDMSKE